MQADRFTIKSQEAIGAAQELARRMGNPEVYPEHLLLALLDQELSAAHTYGNGKSALPDSEPTPAGELAGV